MNKTQIRVFVIVDELVDSNMLGYNKSEVQMTFNRKGMNLEKAKEIMNKIIDLVEKEASE